MRRLSLIAFTVLIALPGWVSADDDPSAWGPALGDHARCLPGAGLVTEALWPERCESWVARHDEHVSYGPDDARDVAVNPIDGSVYVTGLTDDAAGTDVLTVAIDPTTGLNQWVSRVHLTSLDIGKFVAVSPDGGTVYIGGHVRNNGYDFLALALDAATGATTWTANYDGPAQAGEFLADMLLSPDGTRLYLAGESPGDGTGRDAVVVAFDTTDGATVWVDRIDGPVSGTDQATALAISADGHTLFMTGDLQTDTRFADRDIVVAAYDTTTGGRLWLTTHAIGTAADSGNDIAVTPDGTRVVVTGTTYTYPGSVITTLALDGATGAKFWQTTYDYDAATSESGSFLAVTPDGTTAIIAGESENEPSTGDSVLDIVTIGYDLATGQERWVQRYDGLAAGLDRVLDMALAPDGSRVVVSGTSNTGPAATFPEGPSMDAIAIAYDTDTGDAAWHARYNGLAGRWDTATAAAFSPAGDFVYLAGATEGYDGTDYLTLAYRN